MYANSLQPFDCPLDLYGLHGAETIAGQICEHCGRTYSDDVPSSGVSRGRSQPPPPRLRNHEPRPQESIAATPEPTQLGLASHLSEEIRPRRSEDYSISDAKSDLRFKLLHDLVHSWFRSTPRSRWARASKCVSKLLLPVMVGSRVPG